MHEPSVQISMQPLRVAIYLLFRKTQKLAQLLFIVLIKLQRLLCLYIINTGGLVRIVKFYTFPCAEVLDCFHENNNVFIDGETESSFARIWSEFKSRNAIKSGRTDAEQLVEIQFFVLFLVTL